MQSLHGAEGLGVYPQLLKPADNSRHLTQQVAKDLQHLGRVIFVCKQREPYT